jgi:GTP diphosphokinase / guanosine-3',5'-bis(diphosphate) 3'-diphosphatase
VLSNNPEEQARLIPVTWDVTTDHVYKANIVIQSADKPGMMVDIMMAISENKININNISSHTNKDKVATIHLGLDITNTSQLDAIMNRIKRIQGVYRVERMTAGTGDLGKKKK